MFTIERKKKAPLDEAAQAAAEVMSALAEARTAEEMYMRTGGSNFQQCQWEEAVMEAAIASERLTHRLRSLILDSGFRTEPQRVFREQLIQAHGIRVIYREPVLQIRLPFLLPHRKRAYTDFIYQPLYLALQSWCEMRLKEGLELPAYEQATLCYCHIYNAALSRNRIRDHDNIEQKQAADAIGMFFLRSDGGLYLDTYHTTLLGDEDQTMLFLIPSGQFASWIDERQRLYGGIEK